MNSDEHEAKLEGLKNQCENRISFVKLLDQSILNITSSDDYENELIESEEYYDTSFELLAKISQKFNRIPNKPTIPLTTATSHPDTSINSNSTLPPGGPKLPKLKIQKIDGEIINWQTFWDQLESSIDSRENITDIDKFVYLRNLLCDSARETISGLTLTSENYKNAVQLLRDRFANRQVHFSAYMEQLYKLKRVESMSNVHDLRKLYDKVELSIKNLISLGISSETYGAFLVPLLTDKLPASLRLSVARKMTSEIWNLTDMMYYFKIELVAHERCPSYKCRKYLNESLFSIKIVAVFYVQKRDK